MPAPSRTHVAEGNLAKVIYAVVIFVVVVAVGTFMKPWLDEYEVKTAARIACNEIIKGTRYKLPEQVKNAENTFERKALMAGVHLKTGQSYVFEVSDISNEDLWRCHFKAAWKSSTPLLIVSALYPEAPPIQRVHRLDNTYDTKNSF